MKKYLSILMLCILLALSTACSQQPKTGEPPASTEASSPEMSEPTPVKTTEPAVVFTDLVLEELVRGAMNKPEGDITLTEAAAVTELNLEMDGGAPLARVADVSDLTQFPNLTVLNLNWAINKGDEAVDLSPLASLKKLECLYICCCGNTADISPLAGLTSMKDLWIWGNNITDISALEGMTQMESLWIKTNQITDISALSKMENLAYLYMEDNQVADLSPLAGLSKLTHILLSGNPATDYSPLKDVYSNLVEKDFEIN